MLHYVENNLPYYTQMGKLVLIVVLVDDIVI